MTHFSLNGRLSYYVTSIKYYRFPSNSIDLSTIKFTLAGSINGLATAQAASAFASSPLLTTPPDVAAGHEGSFTTGLRIGSVELLC